MKNKIYIFMPNKVNLKKYKDEKAKTKKKAAVPAIIIRYKQSKRKYLGVGTHDMKLVSQIQHFACLRCK